MRDSFVFYKSFWEAIKELTPEDREKILYTIMEYALNGKEDPEISGVSKAVFTLIKPQIDANNIKYENGRKGGRPPKNNQKDTGEKPKNNQDETKKEPKEKQEVTEPERNVNDNVNVNDNDNDNVKHEYGKYKHVLLTENNLQDLHEKFGKHKTHYLIKLLDEGIQLKGYSYNDHYLAILNWEKNDKSYKPPPSEKKKPPELDMPNECPVCKGKMIIPMTYGAAKCKSCGRMLNYNNGKWEAVA